MALVDARRAKRVIRDQEAEIEANPKSEKIVESLPSIGEGVSLDRRTSVYDWERKIREWLCRFRGLHRTQLA